MVLHETYVFQVIELHVLWMCIEIADNQHPVREVLMIDSAECEQVRVAAIA